MGKNHWNLLFLCHTELREFIKDAIMGYFPSFSSSNKQGPLEESDYFSRLELAKDQNELRDLLKEGQSHFANLGRFGLADKVAIAEPNQGLSLKSKI